MSACASGSVGFPAENFPKERVFLSIPIKPYSFHSVHSAIGSRMNTMIFRSENGIAPKSTQISSYSEYSYSGIVPKERALTVTSASIMSSQSSQWAYCLNSIYF